MKGKPKRPPFGGLFVEPEGIEPSSR